MSSNNRDPIQGLIDYINIIKPYHTKIAEIRVVYKHNDLINANFTENINMYINIKAQDFINSEIQEGLLFGVDYIKQNENIKVTVVDRTSDGAWDVPSWDSEGWDLPFVGPFMNVTQNINDNQNVNILEDHLIANNTGGDMMGVGVIDTISFIGASHPTIKLFDSINVNIQENTQASIYGLNLIGAWDANYWDIVTYDENIGALINLS